MKHVPLSGNARGLTIVEVLAVIVVICLIVAILLPAIGGRGYHRGDARRIKDASQVRGIVQSMAIFANNNGDNYPLPSLLDPNNATTAEEGAAKDHTANVLSILIFQGSVSPEMYYNPAETSGKIQIDTDYEFDMPKAAVDPAKALWDPAFAADFTGPGGSNVSYAHARAIAPAEDRPSVWHNTFSATQAVFGDRGPEVSSVTVDRTRGRSVPTYVNADSNTFAIHGGRRTWEGNIAYNDGHVNFEMSTSPDGLTYDGRAAKTPDNLFFDEPDDAGGINAFLGVFIKAGPEKQDFRAIWD